MVSLTLLIAVARILCLQRLREFLAKILLTLTIREGHGTYRYHTDHINRYLKFRELPERSGGLHGVSLLEVDPSSLCVYAENYCARRRL